MNGQVANLVARIEQFALFVDGKVAGVDLALTAADASVAFVGQAGVNPVAADGTLTADLADLGAIFRLAGVARPGLPQGLGAGSVTVTGDLTLTSRGSAHLRGGAVGLDDTRLSVEADLTTDGPRPKLSAQVGAGALQLVGLATEGASGAGAAAESAAGWSTAIIDVSALGLMDATIALSADSLDLGFARFGATRTVMTLERARAVFTLRQLTAYQGAITGQFVVNGRGGLSLGGDLVASGVAMQPLLQDVAGYDRLLSTGDMTLKFLAVGNSVDALMQGLSGSGSLRFGRGEVRGLDLAGMLRTLDPGHVGAGQKTIFDGITGSYAIEKGILSNSDLAFTAPYVTANGAGDVGIGARTLDYRLRPTALAEADGTGGVMVPLLITGTWAAPRFRLDLESLAKERLAEEAKALEARARAEADAAQERLKTDLRAKAEAELGLVQQEGESLEDAAKRRAREAVDAETIRLLERLLGDN
jgi:AsmA protein